ncbi:hypothetical protein AKO1_014488 [Acrasis kona]|uniref:Uncharacterized protein n=1 Tax=Acrasis kona TaxID=1008807 RepID=A0AAW2Z5F0_9EUKA
MTNRPLINKITFESDAHSQQASTNRYVSYTQAVTFVLSKAFKCSLSQTEKSGEAHIQADEGEKRELCSVLLVTKERWRGNKEYCAH